MLNKILIFMAMTGMALLSMQVQADVINEEFPLRQEYKEIKTISAEDLKSRLNDVLVIDVRTPFEFEIMHIDGAMNIPLTTKAVVQAIVDAQFKANKPVVFYCYGTTCDKSYSVARKVHDSHVNFDFSVFDGGIVRWAKSYPEKTLFFGKVSDGDKVISSEDFKKHLLEPLDFFKRVESNQMIGVIDVRYGLQLSAVSIFPGREYHVGFDVKKLTPLIEKMKSEGRPIYVYDDAGHQVQSIQYLLNEMGVTDYMFMKGGVSSYFKVLGN